mmetsp:Transcript_166137/g.319079  ORF Transcript_166137/g.319079 Transcript_166137/m.319079 type:complete len:202 (-) Transcript_166137:16-621(-)
MKARLLLSPPPPRCLLNICIKMPISWSRCMTSSFNFLASASRAAARFASPDPALPPSVTCSRLLLFLHMSRNILKEARKRSIEPQTKGCFGSAVFDTYCKTKARHCSTPSGVRACSSPLFAIRTSSFNSSASRFNRAINKLGSSSSFTFALFWICATRCAKLQVEIDSPRLPCSTAMQPIIVVLQLPPSESRSTLVIIELR